MYNIFAPSSGENMNTEVWKAYSFLDIWLFWDLPRLVGGILGHWSHLGRFFTVPWKEWFLLESQKWLCKLFQTDTFQNNFFPL